MIERSSYARDNRKPTKTKYNCQFTRKNNIYQAVINYKDDNNKRKQKWVSTGIKVACGNKKIAMQKAEEYRKQFEKSFNLKEQIKKENDKQAKVYVIQRKIAYNGFS